MKGNRHWLIYILASLLLFLSISGCSGENYTMLLPNPFKVALLVEGNIYDQGWDSSAYEGLKKIERQLNAQVDYFEFQNKANTEKIKSKATEMIENGYHVIFGHGAVFETAFNQLGPRFPNVKFLLINGDTQEKNVYSIKFSGQSMGFFAGIGAAYMSKSHIVGVVTAYPDQDELKGFTQGVHFVNDQIRVITNAVGSWGDRDRGKMIADDLILQGVDVLFGAGDAFNIDVINSAKNNGIYAIGFIRDQSFIARNTVLYSVTQNIGEVYLNLAKTIKNTQPLENHTVIDFHTGGQRISTFSGMVPKEVQNKIIHVLDLYLSGRVQIS